MHETFWYKHYYIAIIVLVLIQLNPGFTQFILPVERESNEIIKFRFTPPDGYNRLVVDKNSFAQFLRDLPLLPNQSPVFDYRNNQFKSADDTSVAAVVNMNIRGKKLLQCMDIILRLYIEYQIQNDAYSKIKLILPDGLQFSWNQWATGYRSNFAGMNYFLKRTAKVDSSYQNFNRYLNHIFALSGTQAFYHYFPDIELSDIQIGDFIVKKGYKGHAVIIVDLAVNDAGHQIALIGQGDTPACQFYLLRFNKDSAWFPIDTTVKFPPLPIKKKMYWSGLRRFSD